MSADKVYSDSEFRDAFLFGAAKAYFVSAYADFVEDQTVDQERPQDAYDYLAYRGGGGDWHKLDLTIPPNAYALAGELWNGLMLNAGPGGIYKLSALAKTHDGCEPDAEEFGHYFAMESIGHGVSWFDDHAVFPIEVPSIECSGSTFDQRAYRSANDKAR